MATLRQRYSYMVWMREFELACLEGVATREIHGELHTAIGQEAIGAGMAGFLRADDAMCSGAKTPDLLVYSGVSAHQQALRHRMTECPVLGGCVQFCAKSVVFVSHADRTASLGRICSERGCCCQHCLLNRAWLPVKVFGRIRGVGIDGFSEKRLH